jgi:hypothetical protein
VRAIAVIVDNAVICVWIGSAEGRGNVRGQPDVKSGKARQSFRRAAWQPLMLGSVQGKMTISRGLAVANALIGQGSAKAAKPDRATSGVPNSLPLLRCLALSPTACV